MAGPTAIGAKQGFPRDTQNLQHPHLGAGDQGVSIRLRHAAEAVEHVRLDHLKGNEHVRQRR
eukprot:528059-Prorocentrum_minimum.AAC.1